MSTNVLALAPGGQALNQSLGFGAASVIVDNFTSSYLSLPDAGKTLPPWVYGAVVSLPYGINRARARLVPTVPAIAGPPVPVSQASLTWTEARLPDSPGQLLQASQYALREDLGTITSAANGGSASQSFALPAGTTAVGLIVDFSVSGNPAQMTLTGDQTNEGYATLIKAVNPLLGDFGGGPFVYQVVPRDTSVTVNLNSQNPGSACTVRVIAYLDVASVFVQQNRGSFFNVTSSGASPAPWQSAQSKLVSSSTTLAATYKQILAPVGAGVQLYLFWAYFVLDAASGGVFAVGTDGLTANVFVTNDNGKGPYVIGPLPAEPQGTNSGLWVFTTSPATVRYHVAYTAL